MIVKWDFANALYERWRIMPDEQKQIVASHLRNRDVMWAYVGKDERTIGDIFDCLVVEYHTKQRARIVKDLLGKYHTMLQKKHWQDLLDNSVRFKSGQSGE